MGRMNMMGKKKKKKTRAGKPEKNSLKVSLSNILPLEIQKLVYHFVL